MGTQAVENFTPHTTKKYCNIFIAFVDMIRESLLLHKNLDKRAKGENHFALEGYECTITLYVPDGLNITSVAQFHF